MAAVQTSYSSAPAIGYPGQIADSGDHDIKSVIVETATSAGLVVLTGASTRAEGRPPAAPDAADADGFITNIASAATAQTLSGASLNGAIGAAAMLPPRNVVLVLSNHADWDLTTAVVTGEDEEGRVVQEALVIPNGGNATVTGVQHFRKITSLYIPAQSGTGGTATMGTGSSLGPIGHIDVHGVAVYDASREPEAYAADDVMPCLRRGRIYVTSESSYSDQDPVYVRFVATGDEVRGQVRNAHDSTDCALLKNARYRNTGSAGVAMIELNLP